MLPKGFEQNESCTFQLEDLDSIFACDWCGLEFKGAQLVSVSRTWTDDEDDHVATICVWCAQSAAKVLDLKGPNHD